MSADLLTQLLAGKAREIERRAAARPLPELRAAVEGLAPPRGFLDAIERDLARGAPAIIAELKKASPSRGIIRADFDPAELARDLAAHGATCLSVLTDKPGFHGRKRYIGAARDACPLPIIRKDFIIDSYQVFEARCIGADAVLLIVAALGDPALGELAQLAQLLGMDVLVEVHDLAELERALRLPCRLIGVNNRNLHTFETRLETTLDLLDCIPEDRIVVCESGLRSGDDIARMRRHGVHTFLVGETLMRAERPGEKLAELFAG